MKKNIFVRTLEFTVVLTLIIAVIKYVAYGSSPVEALLVSMPIGIGYMIGYKHGTDDK